MIPYKVALSLLPACDDAAVVKRVLEADYDDKEFSE
jgi:hypothetical protein